MNQSQSHMKSYTSRIVESPVGPLQLVANARGLAAILWKDDDPKRVRLDGRVESLARSESIDGETNSILLETERQLSEYFAGQRQVFAVRLDLSGTRFQKQVWNALLTIPYGETRSYGQIASQIGHPTAIRAV